MAARTPTHLMAPTPALLDRLKEVVGPANALTDPAEQAPHLREWRDRYAGKTPLVLKPGTVEEVSRCLALCHEARVGVVPQAGNTGLVGGQIPADSGTEIVLSVERLRRVRGADVAATSLVVEAGLTLLEVQDLAEERGRLFPLSMASEGSARIGGVLATNAGGVAVLAYGSARNLALGLEVVLADGRIWNGLGTLRKDNTGYDLKDLFIGSEGTLGIITAAALKLVPRPAGQATALVALNELSLVLALFRLAEERCGTSLTAFEFLSGRGLEFVLKHEPRARAPFSRTYPWSVLIEISTTETGRAGPLLEQVLAAASERGLLADTAIAGSMERAGELWRLRESMSEVQKAEGGSIKHDVSVPLPAIPEFVARANALVERLCPGARPVPFGHFGDGNVHYNISQPAGMDKARFLASWEEMQRAVHGLVVEMGGSISAEHGIGQLKRAELALVKDRVALDLMRAIKAALDPNGILNPGKLL